MSDSNLKIISELGNNSCASPVVKEVPVEVIKEKKVEVVKEVQVEKGVVCPEKLQSPLKQYRTDIFCE